jgi:hypothetical protein
MAGAGRWRRNIHFSICKPSRGRIMMKISNRRIAAVVGSVGVLGAIVAGAAGARPAPALLLATANTLHGSATAA